MPRISAQGAVRAQQRAIDAPGVDADAIEREPPFPAGDGETLADLVEQPQRIPMQPRKHAHRRVGEAMQFLDGQRAVSKRSQHRASALRAEIECQIALAHGISMTTLPTLSAYAARSSKASGVLSSGQRWVTIWSPMRPDSISSMAPCAL